MHSPGNSEPQLVSGRQQVHRDKLSAIPIKKRRFLIVSPPSPEEKIPDSGDCESKNKQDPQIPDEKESNNNQESPIDPNNAPTTSDFAANRDVNPSDIKSGGATVEIFVSEPQGISLNPGLDSRNETDDISPKEKKSSGSEVPESYTGPQTSIVKQEIELSSEQKRPFVLPDLERKKPVAICPEPEKLDPSMLSLALSEDRTVGDVGSIRSNWDLNTTMEDWEGASSKSDSLVAHTFADIGGFVKTRSCHNEKFSLPTSENVGLGLSKGKQHIQDVQKPNSSNATTLVSTQCKIDDSLVLRLEMPRRESLSLSGNFISSVNPRLGSQPVQMSATNTNRAVKLEPVAESSRHDCSVGSSSNMVSLRLGSVKMESLNNLSLETVLKSPVNPDKVVNQSRSMRPKVHQESCESSFSLTVPLMPQNYIERSDHNKDLQLEPCNKDYRHKLARVDKAAAKDEEKINVLSELNEKGLLESDCGSRGNSVGIIRQSIRGKGDEDLEEGEVREPVQLPVIGEAPSDVCNNLKNLEYVRRDSENLQGSGKEDSAKEKHVKSDLNKESVSVSVSCKPNSEDGNNNHLHNASDTVLEVRGDEKTFVSVTPDKQTNPSGRKNIEEASVKEVWIDRKTNVDSGIGSFDLEDAATTNANKASLSGQDAAKDSGNKRRIINLSHASKSPGKMRPITNRLMVPRSGKERYSDLDGDIQPCGNRERNFSGGSNKFVKDRVNDQSLRNSRHNFMRGRGRKSGRFNSLHSNEWDSNHDFAPETSYGPSNYRRKHARDADIECDGYNIPQDGNNNNRRKTAKNEFPQANSRRLSPGDNSNRNGSANRGNNSKNNQTFWRFPRNMSPNDDMFTRNLSDDLMSHVYNHPEAAMYDEPDGQLDWDNWNFSRKGYTRIRSKSPVSPYRRFPNELHDLPQHRSPGFYQTRRMRSPDQRCFRDEIFPRRRGSPYGSRHLNDDLWISRNPGQVFPRSARRNEVLDSREMGDGDEYMNNGSFQANKFHDERRNFDGRRGPKPGRLFQPGYNCGEGENFRFHMNEGPSPPYRFCPETDAEFVEIGDNIRERKFDGRIKHQHMGPSRRNRNVEELHDGNYRPVERVWHDDGFGDDDGKKRRF